MRNIHKNSHSAVAEVAEEAEVAEVAEVAEECPWHDSLCSSNYQLNQVCV